MQKWDNILWLKTKKNVESIIAKYINYNLFINNSTLIIDELFILKNVEMKKESAYTKVSKEKFQFRLEFINYFIKAFNRLTTVERKIIYWTYIDKENSYNDDFISNRLGYSLGYYYTKKKDTLIRFAYSLGVEESNNKNA